MPYRVKNLVQCITDSLSVNLEFQQTQGFYEPMGDVFKGKKEVWPMGNHEETFKYIGRTIQLYKSLGELGPIIKNIIATQSNLCTMEPATFLHDIMKVAEEMNKF